MVQYLVPALTGALAALVLRSLLKWVAKAWAEHHPIAVYPCDGSEGRPGLLGYGWGHSSQEDKKGNKGEKDETSREEEGHQPEPKGKREKVFWVYQGDPRPGGREHTIFGPYVNNFGRPGYYKIRFRIAGVNFPRDADQAVVVLDVIRVPFAKQDDYVLHGQRFLKARELGFTNGKFKPFDVVVFASGNGIYEYRCSVIESAFDQEKQKILFSDVRVYRYFPPWELL